MTLLLSPSKLGPIKTSSNFPNRNNGTQNSNGIVSPPPFYTKRSTRKLPKMSNINSFQNVNPKIQSLMTTQNQ